MLCWINICTHTLVVPSGIIAILLCSQYTGLCVHKKEFIQYCISLKWSPSYIHTWLSNIPSLDRSKGASGSLKLFLFVCMCFCCAHHMCAHECRLKKSISGVVPQDDLFLFLYMCICMCTRMQVPTEVKKGFEFYGAGVTGSCEALDVVLESELGSLIVSTHNHQAISLALFFEPRSFTETRGAACLHCPSAAVMGQHTPGFLCRCWESNTGPWACMARTLLTILSS